jgi:predicted HNH restriction endonuclease
MRKEREPRPEGYRDQVRANRLARQANIKLYIKRYKEKPCSVCGAELDPCQMDLVHRDPNDKLALPAEICKTRWTWSKMEREVLKCDVVCANCHRLLHNTHKGNA